MNTRSVLLFTLATLVLFMSSCNNRQEITEHNVARIISTLSSDEMKGRHAMSPDIKKAADFIANEFYEIGLTQVYDNYRQKFTVYSITPSRSSVTINGQNIEEHQYFSITNTDSINWSVDDISLKNIGETDDFMETFNSFRDDNESSIIAVSEGHMDWFNRYRSYFRRANRTMEFDQKPNDLFVLANGAVNSAEVEIVNNVETLELENIVGKIPGKNEDEIVLFSAHFDHLGIVNPVEEDSVANGANDNASGVAGVIELARYFFSGQIPDRTLYFVGFTAEETGGFGSRYFSEQIDPDKIVAMVNIEMIGKPAVEGENTAWITGFDLTSFGQIFKEHSPNNFKFYADPYPNQNLFYRSDNATLARKGVPAHTISSTPIDVDQDYHQVSDEFKTINISHTINTIRAIAKVSELLASGEATPNRIPLESID
ncbi:MAG: M20/M25/M40 family metallo-hydrolase [Gracilimonas sp.]|nr:M20/M25/M40 family metallo-hydrolase [Gracilimonas sp.]